MPRGGEKGTFYFFKKLNVPFFLRRARRRRKFARLSAKANNCNRVWLSGNVREESFVHWTAFLPPPDPLLGSTETVIPTPTWAQGKTKLKFDGVEILINVTVTGNKFHGAAFVYFDLYDENGNEN